MLHITDPDEEIFLLYTELAGSNFTNHGGLGFVDSRKPIINVTIDVPNSSDSIEVNLAQDVTALRSRKGDTGSVLWRASVQLARTLVATPASFLPSPLSQQNVLELGAGTGLLSIVLAPLVKHYTATDINALLPLLRKNVSLNHSKESNLTIEPLDWIALQNLTPSSRPTYYPLQFLADGQSQCYSLLLAVDCIYNESLIAPLLTAIDHYTVPDVTSVLVVSELRSEDVMREFLEQWLARGPSWQIWRLEDMMKMPFVAWLGRKVTSI